MKKSEEKILLAIKSFSPQDITKLSESTGMIRGWVSKGLKALLKQRFIIEEDFKGRSKPYKLTKKGVDAVSHLKKLRELEKK